LIKGFTSKYNVDRLFYFEELPDISQAIVQEKTIKGWTRAKKLALIETLNPEYRDLAVGSPSGKSHSEQGT
jgi:putative endonuclease